MFQISAETLRLKEYLTELYKTRSGMLITYDEISSETDIKMDKTGRSRLRAAARFCGIEYDAVRGVGIELAGSHNGIHIMSGRLARIDNATKRASKAANNISSSHLSKMTPEDQKGMMLIISVFGAIRAQAGAIKILRKQHREIIAVNSKLI